MKAAGIIAEFDPFHNGHRYLLARARTLGNTHIAVAMSGSAVQRGTPAFIDKFSRAKAAVRYGADLVLELPAPYSCSNAQVFANGGVSALAALGEGVITELVFGSEVADTAAVIRAAEASAALSDSAKVKALLAAGMSYPAAVCKAAEERFGKGTASVLSSPNSTLAAEYVRAAARLSPWMSPCAVERKGTGHDSDSASDGFASASKLRSMIKCGEDASGFMPEPFGDCCNAAKLDSILLYQLLAAEKTQLLALPDVSEALADRILKAARLPHKSSSELLEAARSRDVTAARFRRLALHLALGVRREDILPLPYVRVLAFNSRGAELLRAGEHSLPVSTSLKKLEQSSAQAMRVSLLERRASALRGLGTSEGAAPNEYTADIRMSADA